ncbi:hypothetical protein ACKI1J_42890 [Streptomyces scabiei]|uniref:hypothetical protein n=1 Tax=Streptomyces TaxID=1883 RepID=UPI0029AAAB98|nr:hypothetical protein [Streptomyces stelliscabiei]MDX2552573.1 hypothetical protein [Streptomyces stelliscabiei]
MTTSSHPFGFHMPGPMPAPVPLHQAPAAQPAPAAPPAFTGTVPLVVPLARREPLPVCVTCGARHGALVPSGDCYDSGATKFVCASRDCVPGPLEPAVLTGPQDAQPRPPFTPAPVAAEADVARSYDALTVEAIAQSARAQERAEMRAELTAAAEAVETAEWFHTAWLGTAALQAGCQAVRELCEGRPEHYHVPVTAVLRALDGPCPTEPRPMTLTWDNMVAPPAGDRPGEMTLIGCETRFGGRAVLELTEDQRKDLAARLSDTVHPAETCATPGCGLPDDTLNAASPSVWGWIRLDVAGTSDGPRWWCSPPCATAAMTAAGAELAAADQLDATDPARQAPTPAYDGDPLAYGPAGIRCGCGKDAHSNLTPCRPATDDAGTVTE